MIRAAAVLLGCALSLGSLPASADTLAEIYELALENDAQLKAQQAQYKANLEIENLGRAALLPQINAGYDYTDIDRDTEGESFDVGGGGIETNKTKTNLDVDQEGYQVSLDQAIFDMPAWFTFKSGKERTKEAEAIFAADQQDLIVRTVAAYLGVLRAQSNLEASQARERAFQRQLEQTQQRFEVGLIAITDVHEAQAAYDTSRVERIVDENNLNVAIEEVSVLTGRYHSNFHLLKEDFEIKPPEPAKRSDWVDLEQAARQNSRASTSEHLPTVSGGASYRDYETRGDITQTPESEFLTNPDQDEDTTTWQINLQVPLYSGGRISASRRQAAQEYLSARESRINLMRNTVTNTRSFHMSVVSDVARVAARKQSITSSQSALDATTAGYEVGTRNVVDVLQAQNLLFASKRDYANARYDYIADFLTLKLQAGLLSPEDVYWLDNELVPPPAATASTRTGSPYPTETE
jgi:outer membrane protein